MMLLFFIVVYVIGYFICLIFLVNFGKAIGLDYSNQNRDWDDWENNATAYAGISFGWPFLLIVGLFFSIWTALVRLAQFLIDHNESKEV